MKSLRINFLKHVKNLLWIVAEDAEKPTYQGIISKYTDRMYITVHSTPGFYKGSFNI